LKISTENIWKKRQMLDRERILAKSGELERYLKELDEVFPANIEEYKKIEKKRSCERILQLIIECLIDIAKIFVKNLRLGIPSGENDLLKKLSEAKVLSASSAAALQSMRGFRNILIHDYADVDDALVFKYVMENSGDFDKIRREFLEFLKNGK